MDNHITVLSIILTFFTGALMLAFNKSKRAYTTMLGSILLIFSWYTFIHLAVLNSWITQFPYLLRIGRPFYFAIPPLSYLYIKYVIYRKDKFFKSDYLHFIPCFIIFADILCYYLNNYLDPQKIAFEPVEDIPQGAKMTAGFISEITFSLLKVFQALIYTGLLWHLLLLAYKNKQRMKISHVTKKWVLLFSIFITAIQLIIIYNTCQPHFHVSYIDKLNLMFISRLLLLMLVLLLFFYPSVIYSTTDILTKEIIYIETNNTEQHSLEITPEPSIISNERLKFYLEKTEALNKDTRFFKSIDTIAELAEHLQIPSRHLTYILNHHYQLRFNDFINGHRIRYIIRQFETGFLKELTMEAIAFEAGFSSRSTFFTAFKKYTGKNPSQYLKEQPFKKS